MTQHPNHNPPPQLLHYQDGEQKGVGIPAGHHPVTDPAQLDNNPQSQHHIAGILEALGAPEPSQDYLFRWTGVDLDDDDTLWVYYRDQRPKNGGWQY